MDDVRAQSARFNAHIEQFQIKGGTIKLVLTVARRSELLERLSDLCEAREGLEVTLIDRQVRMELFPGTDGHHYPTADATGRPTAARAEEETLPIPGAEGDGAGTGDGPIPLDRERGRRQGRGGPF